MEFAEILAQVIDLLAREKRRSYRALKLRFHLDDEYLEGLKEEIIYAKRLAVDEEGRVLVWAGDAGALSPPISPAPQIVHHLHALPAAPLQAIPAETASHRSEAERRQLTVLFCDLMDSTALSSQLDPEDWREVVRAYQATCAEIIQGFEGHIAQYLGDGLLVYFGYPQAHEDDAQRAVHTGLGIVEALHTLNHRLGQWPGVHLAVRVGIHTGLVVVGEMGGGGRQEQLALGDTPNIAARLQGLAAPDTVVISTATQRLIQGYFTCHDLGSQTFKGVATPLRVYQVVRATEIQQRFDVAVARGLTPLVGREHEVGLLRDRWAQVQAGRGHIVVLSGEAGIGKSRLVQVVKDEIIGAATLRIEYRCSPSHQHSALYPVIAHLERALAFRQDDTPEDRLRKLEEALRPYPLPLAEVVPLLAALLSLPLPEDRYPPLTLTPQRQKQKTLEALLTWLLALTEQQSLLFVVEDLHWIDPSTLEFLTLLVEQGPTARLLTLLTCRPEFQVPWGLRTHLTPMALQRLPQPEVEVLIAQVTGGKALPPAVLQHVVTKTDGIPLFVEELTKTVLESGLLRETAGHYELTGPLPPLAIPATLHDSLMARLDRLAPIKAVAQLGAVLGRTFSYEVLQAVTPLDEASLQQALARLVEAELLYQRGVPPQATYLFKHALIQEAAYQSLLKSTRQQFHQRIAQVLEARFPALVATQPELVAQHYTVAGCTEQAVVYWQRAGERANERSGYMEAINHLTKGLELLTTLPDTPERTHQELALHTALGTSLTATKGWAAPEVEQVYTRARELCRQVGETVQLFPVLNGLWVFYFVRAELQTARELAEQCLSVVQRVQDPTHLPVAHFLLGHTLLLLGELASTCPHVEQSIALYERPQPPSDAILDGSTPGVRARPRPRYYTTTGGWVAHALWLRGYPDQALTRSHEALALARELSYPFILAVALDYAAMLHQFRRERHAVHERAEAAMVLCQEQDFAYYAAWATILQGWVLGEQGQGAEGMTQMRQGLAALRATGGELRAPYYLTLLAEAHGNGGRAAEGLRVLAEAHTLVEEHEERWWEAEVHRLRGVLLLRQTVAQPEAAETWLQRALDVARHQEAKSLELRAATSLAHLWQQQGKRADAYQLLAEVYNWFTEGFDTADLQEARALLDTLMKE